MYESSYIANNMKPTSYIRPNHLISTKKKYKNNNTNYLENPNINNNDSCDYNSNSMLKPFYNSLNTPLCAEYVNNNNMIKTAPIPQIGNNLGFHINTNCLNSIPCLKNNNRQNEHISVGQCNKNNHNNSNNSNKYMIKKVYKTPCYLQNRQVVLNGCDKSYNNTLIVPHTNENAMHRKNSIKPCVYEHLTNINLQNNDSEIKYIHEPFKKRSTKENLHDSIKKNSLNGRIKSKDEQIKEIEKNIASEKFHNEVDNNLENKKLKQKLLDQKIKYEETLKHLKNVESEKRILKTNLKARNKVLTKLENEIGSVDNENEFLLKVKDNTNLDSIHNVFKYLHGDASNIMKKKLKKKKGEAHLNGNKYDNVTDDDNIYSDNDGDNEYHNSLCRKTYKSCKSTMDRNFLSANENISSDHEPICIKKRKEKNISKKNMLDQNDVYLLKSTVVELEKEIHDLKEENKNVSFKYENTFKTLTELRKDTLEYMESIVSRDMRIAYMETMLQKSEKDLFKLRENYKKQQLVDSEKIDKLASEIKILEKQSSHLQHMIQEKDAQIVLLKNDVIRTETLIKQYEERNKELQNELRLMCVNLENVIEASNKKDLFMNELEKQIRENEVHRQHAYLKEVAKNRKIQTDMKFKEILYDNSAINKIDELHNLKKELYLNKIQMQKAKDAFEALKKTPKAESMLHDSAEYDYSTINNFSECQNEKNISNNEKITANIYTEYKNKDNLSKKKNKVDK